MIIGWKESAINTISSCKNTCLFHCDVNANRESEVSSSTRCAFMFLWAGLKDLSSYQSPPCADAQVFGVEGLLLASPVHCRQTH